MEKATEEEISSFKNREHLWKILNRYSLYIVKNPMEVADFCRSLDKMSLKEMQEIFIEHLAKPESKVELRQLTNNNPTRE